MSNNRDGRIVEQSTKQPDEVEALRQENEKLKKQLEETKQALKTIQDELANIRQNSVSQSGEDSSSGAENHDSEEVNLDRLYKFGNSSLEQNEVKNVLKNLKQPYKSEILKFIKEKQIKELQDYLNNLIDENIIDKSELMRACEEKGIWVYENGHILNDGKFGPQTMEAIKMLKKTDEEKKEDKETLSDNTYGKFEWKYLDGVENRSKVSIGSVKELKDFLKITDSDKNAFTDKKAELLDKYNEEFFKTRNLSFMYFVISNTASPRYEIKSAEKSGNQINIVYGDDGKNRGDTGAEVISSEILFVETNKGENVNWLEEKEQKEKDIFDNVKVKEEIDKPGENEEVEAKNLLEGLPENADVKFEGDKRIDKTKEGEVQEVAVVVTIGDKTKRFVILAKVEGAKIKLEDKEEKEKTENLEWIKALNIDDLGTWDKDENFIFKEGLIDKESGNLTVKDKTIPKLEEGGNGFAYSVENGRLRIGNLENGVLNGIGVEFYPYGDGFQETEEHNKYGLKLQGEWKEGELKDGLEIVRENGLNIDIEIKEGKPTKAYSEDESISVDFENREDGLYLKNKNSTLKLKNKYSSVQILKILHDYKDKEGSFSTDLSEGYKSKKLIWTPADGGENKEVYRYADSLISDEMFESEGLRLSGWLNEYRETHIETHREFKLEEYGEFDSEGNFNFKKLVEKTDENGKYIEFNKEKYYEYKDGMNGLGYKIGKNNNNIGGVYLGNYVNGKLEGKGISARSIGDRYEGEWKDDKKEGKGTYFWTKGDRYEGEFKNGKIEGQGIMTWSNGNKYEGEYKDGKSVKGKFTLVTPAEIEYEVQRDEKGLRIISEGEHKGKYINDEEGTIEEKVEEKKEECKKVKTGDGEVVEGIYYNQETKTYYKEVEGKLEEIKSKTGKPIVEFYGDKSHLERGENKNGRNSETYVDINNKIVKIREFDLHDNLFKFSKYDNAGVLDYTNSFKDGILIAQRNHKQGRTLNLGMVKDLGNDKYVLKLDERYVLYIKNHDTYEYECDEEGRWK